MLKDIEKLQQRQIDRFLKGIKIPPQPDLLLEIQEEKYRDEPDLQRVARMISKDAALSASVLKIINSPFFNLAEKTLSISHAVSLLGLDATFNMVTALLMQQTFDDYGGGGEMQEFWDSAVNVARLGAYLAQRFGNASRDEMYVLGLFHDSAMPLMMNHFSEYRVEMLLHSSSEPIEEMEDRLFDTNHAVIGYLMAREWGLTQNLRDAILDHHRVLSVLCHRCQQPKPYYSMLAYLKLAEHADNKFYGRKDVEWNTIKTLVQEFLALSEPDCEMLLDDMNDVLLGSNQ